MHLQSQVRSLLGTAKTRSTALKGSQGQPANAGAGTLMQQTTRNTSTAADPTVASASNEALDKMKHLDTTYCKRKCKTAAQRCVSSELAQAETGKQERLNKEQSRTSLDKTRATSVVAPCTQMPEALQYQAAAAKRKVASASDEALEKMKNPATTSCKRKRTTAAQRCASSALAQAETGKQERLNTEQSRKSVDNNRQTPVVAPCTQMQETLQSQSKSTAAERKVASALNEALEQMEHPDTTSCKRKRTTAARRCVSSELAQAETGNQERLNKEQSGKSLDKTRTTLVVAPRTQMQEALTHQAVQQESMSDAYAEFERELEALLFPAHLFPDLDGENSEQQSCSNL